MEKTMNRLALTVILMVGCAVLTAQAQAQCNGDIRLVGGSSNDNGRLEIYDQGYWKTVCSKRLNPASATTICRQLGYTAGVLTFSPPVSPTSAPIWPYVIKCDGTESLLADCWRHREYDETCCAHEHDVGIACTGGRSPCDGVVCQNGGTCAVQGNTYICICRPGFTGTHCETGTGPSNCRLDLALFLDSSGSVQFYNKVKEVATYIVNNIPYAIGSNGFQISVIDFSYYVDIHFRFDRYNSKADITGHINSLNHEDHLTNLNLALHTLRSEVVTTINGARPGVPKAAILIVDGEDNVDEYWQYVPNNPPDATLRNATLCKNDGIHLFAVGIQTSKYDPDRLKLIVSPPDSSNLFRYEPNTEPAGYPLYQQIVSALVGRGNC